MSQSIVINKRHGGEQAGESEHGGNRAGQPVLPSKPTESHARNHQHDGGRERQRAVAEPREVRGYQRDRRHRQRAEHGEGRGERVRAVRALAHQSPQRGAHDKIAQHEQRQRLPRSPGGVAVAREVRPSHDAHEGARRHGGHDAHRARAGASAQQQNEIDQHQRPECDGPVRLLGDHRRRVAHRQQEALGAPEVPEHAQQPDAQEREAYEREQPRPLRLAINIRKYRRRHVRTGRQPAQRREQEQGKLRDHRHHPSSLGSRRGERPAAPTLPDRASTLARRQLVVLDAEGTRLLERRQSLLGGGEHLRLGRSGDRSQRFELFARRRNLLGPQRRFGQERRVEGDERGQRLGRQLTNW